MPVGLHACDRRAVDRGAPSGEARRSRPRPAAATRTIRSTRARPARYSSRVSSSARGVARFTRSVMPMPCAASAWRGVAVARHEPGRERRRPEAVAGPGEADAGVGRVDRRVEPAHQQAHPRPDGVGQRAGAGGARLEPERFVGVDRARVDGEARADQDVGRARPALHAENQRPGKSSSGSSPLVSPACSDEVHRRVDRERVVQVGERRGQPLVRDVEVAGPGPARAERRRRNGSASRSACTGQASGAASRARRTIAWAASSATTGRARDARWRPAPHPRSTLTAPGDVIAARARTWSRNRGRRRSRHSSARASYTATVSRSISVS